jgi:hypothetical protein
VKTQVKTSKLIISTWGIQQHEALTTSPGTEPDSTSQDAACNLEAPEPVPGHKARKRALPKHLQRPWQPEHAN